MVKCGNMSIRCGMDICDHQGQKITPTRTTGTLGQLTLVSGMLACAKFETLTRPISMDMDLSKPHGHEIHQSDCSLASCDEQTVQSYCSLMYPWLFGCICDFCSSEHQYHGFKVLLQWFQKFSKMIHTFTKRESLFIETCLLTKRTLQILWTNLDSPVVGVNESVLDVFRIFMDMYVKQKSNTVDFKDKGQCILESVVVQTMTLTWHVKGKHGLLTVLCHHLGGEKVKNLVWFWCAYRDSIRWWSVLNLQSFMPYGSTCMNLFV